ncbi:MAG: hypothetical protein FWD48_05155 [Oscillospiraceae bacterium]|nr:hypothetical protein [Oscillospiraceae bacterium]
MEWKRENINKTELERKQSDYMKAAMDMAKRGAPAPAPAAEKIAPAPEPEPPVGADVSVRPQKEETPKPVKKIVEKKVPVPVVVEKIVEKPVVVEKIVEKPVVVEKIIEKPVIVENKQEITLNQSKKIEINADVDINIDAEKLVKKGKEIIEKIAHVGDGAPDVPQIEEPEEFSFPDEEMIEGICAEEEEETEYPFENFKTCEDTCSGRPAHSHRRCENSAGRQKPPNFNKFINEHNKRNCNNQRPNCNKTSGAQAPRDDGRGFSTGGSGGVPGGFSWKDFKKN